MASDVNNMALSWPHQLSRWAGRIALSNKLAIALAIAAIVSGVATYGSITEALPPLKHDPEIVFVLLTLDSILLLLFAGLISWRLVRLWIDRRQGSIGSRLHARLVALFSFIAVTPAIIVAVFSIGYMTFRLEAWFSERVDTALERSMAIAESYREAHRTFVRADLLSMAAAINRVGPRLLESQERFNALVEELVEQHEMAEAIVLREDGKGLARNRLSFVLAYDSISIDAMRRARDGEVVIFDESEDRVRALTRLDSIIGAYLYVGRFVDPAVVNHINRLKSAVGDYRALETQRSEDQITLTLLFVAVALLLLFAAVWIGLGIANRLVRPISSLVGAAERVRTGDLSARVEEGPDGDEIATLSRAFNRMTDQLEGQRAELVEANRQLDERRRFTETVLLGVSAGVLGLDPEGRIFLPNRSALELLSCEFTDLSGRALEVAVPEMKAILHKIRSGRERVVRDEVILVRQDRARTLSVQITAERQGPRDLVTGYVVTFDDVTELISAQRAAAWGDVARRIAHEIKNPLTPIQLSAERLKRKYLKQLDSESDSKVFSACTDTIVRQVADIRHMVDEFSAFARMPAPVRAREDIVQVIRGVLSMQEWARPEIDFVNELPDEMIAIYCDRRQVVQAVTNLLHNAVDAIEAHKDQESKPIERGLIRLSVDQTRVGECRVSVEDNGRGLPTDSRDRLTEPYVTTRSKGTGLGLAIVKKIMEDHDGRLELRDGTSGGACVTLVFSAVQPPDFANDSDKEPAVAGQVSHGQ